MSVVVASLINKLAWTVDRVIEIRNYTVEPSVHFVAKDAEAAGPTGTNRPFGDDAPFRAVRISDRRLLNHVVPLRHDHLKGGVVELTRRALLDFRRDSFIDLSVQAHEVPARPQREPVQVDSVGRHGRSPLCSVSRPLWRPTQIESPVQVLRHQPAPDSLQAAIPHS